MNGTQDTREVCERLLDEHRELRQQITEFRQWSDEVDQRGIPRFREMGDRLKHLREILANHFADEEQGGYLAGVLEIAPRFADEVDELRPQHAAMLFELDDLIARLMENEPPFNSWQAAGREYDALLSQLAKHESRENAIVQSAYGQDIAAGD